MKAAFLPLLSSKESKRGAPKFDRLARFYRWMELFTFGSWLERCRFAYLGEMADCRRALVLGDGDGRFTAKLLRVNSTIEIDAVDASPAMLRALIRRARSDAARIHAHCADARDWQPVNLPYDLIATHFFLDCLTDSEVRALIQRIRGALSPSGRWVISEFRIPQGRFGRRVARPIVWLLYRAFGLLTGLAVRALPDHASAFRAAGFHLSRRQSLLNGLLIAESWSIGVR
jgi:SAM-dependent methyltransferase